MESGDRLEHVADENILFMPNHQSTADVPLCMTLFTARTHFADRVMWIMDRIFKYSNFGCVSWMHDDFFILAVSFSNLTLILSGRNFHKMNMNKNTNRQSGL